jgi:hypothetical protein
MTKVQADNSQEKKKIGKDDDEDILVGRVKKVVKKSRRKLSEEKFERQLQRTITFLEELKGKINDSQTPPAEAVKKKKPDNSRKKEKPAQTRVKQVAKTGAKPSK